MKHDRAFQPSAEGGGQTRPRPPVEEGRGRAPGAVESQALLGLAQFDERVARLDQRDDFVDQRPEPDQ